MKHASCLLLLLLCVWGSWGLLPLQKEELNGQYEIGTIQDLHFGQRDRILFRSDDDLFGFIGEKDGKVIRVYELEEGERILEFSHGMEVIIAKDKNLNIFWPAKHSYVRSYESKILLRHPNFTELVDFHRTPEGSLVLTDQYLMRVPHAQKGSPLSDIKEELVITQKQQTEVFFSILPFYDSTAHQIDSYLVSTLPKNSIPQVCFRRVSEQKPAYKCVSLKHDDKLVDVVQSGMQTFVEVEGGAVVLDDKLEVMERINEQPDDYIAGFVTISDHRSYSAHSKVTHGSRLIVSRRDSGKLLALKVEETLLTVQKVILAKEITFQSIATIPKSAEDEVRKVWSHWQQEGKGKEAKEADELRVFIELQSGKLLCYEITDSGKMVEKRWQLITIPAEKVPAGQLEPQQDSQQNKQDIEENKQGGEDARQP